MLLAKHLNSVSYQPVRLFLLLGLMLNLNLHAAILTVKQDGTGDYILIQEAIEASIDGDTVLVWPGTYLENLEIINKNITLGSLTLTTGNMDYAYNTVIDGNQTGSCIDIANCPFVSISGLSLVNGVGRVYGITRCGGGIFIDESAVTISKNIISFNNTIGPGGGIWIRKSSIFFSGTTIKHNSSYTWGGGICGSESQLIFDQIDLCNIYCNTAAIGTDVHCINGMPPYIYNHIIVDTFTVNYPDYYYLYSTAADSNLPGNTISWDILHGKLEQTTENIYVSNIGDNNNSGLSPQEPLKNIWSALLRMKSDSLSPDTIVLAEGIYSPSNGEKFPLSLKSDISIRGASRDRTILDAEDEIYHLHGIYFANNYNICDLTLTNGNGNKNSVYGFGSLILEKNINASITNVLFTSNSGGRTANGEIATSNNFRIDNCDFIDNYGRALGIVHGDYYLDYYDTVYVTNCKFERNVAFGTDAYYVGGGLSIVGSISKPNTHECVVVNCLFDENNTKNINNGAGATGLETLDGPNAYVINCTFADNTSNNPQAAALGVLYGSDVHLYNTIVYNNQYGSAYMLTETYAGECNLYINNSLIDGGKDDINLLYGINNLFYDESNIDTNPSFYGGFEFPYNLSENSPCIDAGTNDIPDWIEIPETDLAGNPRVYGATIDMGAYEWNPTVGTDQTIIPEKEKVLMVAPNPFSTDTRIMVKTNTACHMQLAIYNNSGQRVKVLMDGTSLAGTSIIHWHGEDEYNRSLPSGIYHVVFVVDGKEVEEVGVVKR